jgi:hypothetical protein
MSQGPRFVIDQFVRISDLVDYRQIADHFGVKPVTVRTRWIPDDNVPFPPPVAWFSNRHVAVWDLRHVTAWIAARDAPAADGRRPVDKARATLESEASLTRQREDLRHTPDLEHVLGEPVDDLDLLTADQMRGIKARYTRRGGTHAGWH